MSAKSKRNILFISLPSALGVFKESKISIAVPLIPLISIAQLASVSRESGYTPYALDLAVKKKESAKERIVAMLKDIEPEYCSITFTTPLSGEADSIAQFIKSMNPCTKLITGGPHATIMPEETLQTGNFDIVVRGEGEITLKELLAGNDPRTIKGIAFRDASGIVLTEPRPLIENLDTLPLPDYSIFDAKEYFTPRVNCRKNPVVAMETSRGCVYGCVYCNKSIFGRRFRSKSPKRTVDEMVHLLSYGYNEIHIWDDGFSTDLNRAKETCREIKRRGLKIVWNIFNGLRVDRIDKELLLLLKESGCYRISIGVESGNQDILNWINKGTKIEKIKETFELARDVGIETVAFCMMGSPGETEETMMQTINFVNELKPTIPKLSIMMPLPGTPIFEEWDRKGYIISKNWSNYIFHQPQKVYNHPNLDWATINKYYHMFYRKTMLNPEFLTRRLVRDIKTGELFIDAYYFLKSLKWGW